MMAHASRKPFSSWPVLFLLAELVATQTGYDRCMNGTATFSANFTSVCYHLIELNHSRNKTYRYVAVFAYEDYLYNLSSLNDLRQTEYSFLQNDTSYILLGAAIVSSTSDLPTMSGSSYHRMLYLGAHKVHNEISRNDVFCLGGNVSLTSEGHPCITVSFSDTPPPRDCPGNFVGTPSACFEVPEKKVNYENGEQMCIGLGGYVAEITSAQENMEAGAVVAEQPAFIGVKYLAENNTWVFKDGTPISYANWDFKSTPRENPAFDCIWIISMAERGYPWLDRPCIDNVKVVCEFGGEVQGVNKEECPYMWTEWSKCVSRERTRSRRCVSHHKDLYIYPHLEIQECPVIEIAYPVFDSFRGLPGENVSMKIPLAMNLTGATFACTDYPFPNLNITENGTMSWVIASMASYLESQQISCILKTEDGYYQNTPINIAVHDCGCSIRGTCVLSAEGIVGLGPYVCHCEEGFEGELCSIDLDECASNPCYPGVECIDLNDMYWCVGCPEGMAGNGETCIDLPDAKLLTPSTVTLTEQQNTMQSSPLVSARTSESCVCTSPTPRLTPVSGSVKRSSVGSTSTTNYPNTSKAGIITTVVSKTSEERLPTVLVALSAVVIFLGFVGGIGGIAYWFLNYRRYSLFG